MTSIKRKPDIAAFSTVDGIETCTIDGCIDFTIQNTGNTVVWFGFSRDSQPDIPLEPGDASSFPLYRGCEEWSGDLYIRFGENGGLVRVIRTL